jgi:transposase-like protein
LSTSKKDFLYWPDFQDGFSINVFVGKPALTVWGLDMVGPFKRSKNKHTHLLVAVDKFTKWVEAEPVSRCDAAIAVKFLKKLIFHFGYPHSIITDNGTNLSKGVMKQFCQ